MSRLIDADALIEILAVMQGRCNTKTELIHNSKIWQQVKDMPTVDAIPIEWLTAQADNPSNSDKLRNAIDYIVYTLWAERKEE